MTFAGQKVAKHKRKEESHITSGCVLTHLLEVSVELVSTSSFSSEPLSAS